MAKKEFEGLPTNTLIDIVATKGDRVFVQQMTIQQSRFIVKKKGWIYRNYQIGYHSYKTNI